MYVSRPIWYCYYNRFFRLTLLFLSSMVRWRPLAKQAWGRSPVVAWRHARRPKLRKFLPPEATITLGPNSGTASYNLWFIPSTPCMMVSIQVPSNDFFSFLFRCLDIRYIGLWHCQGSLDVIYLSSFVEVLTGNVSSLNENIRLPILAVIHSQFLI